jgi:hypothetical protein
MSPPGRQRVVLHVGVPNSGASVVQAALSHHRKALLPAGLLYPDGEELLFHAALDVRGNHQEWGRKRGEVEGAWDRLCLEARRHQGTTVISSELLAAVPKRKVTSALSMLGGLEVHLVVTARDLASHLAAGWQESVMDGRFADVEEFCAQVLSHHRTHEQAQRSWASQDLPEVLARWGSDLPRENVHVVCCPQSTDSSDKLWARFAEVVELDPIVFPLPHQAPPVPSLGVTHIDLLRRVNAALADDRFEQPQHRGIATQYFFQALASQHPSAPPELPVGVLDDVVAVAKRWVGEIKAARYHVHGDTGDLVPASVSAVQRHPEEIDRSADTNDDAVTVIAELLREVDRLRSRTARLKSDKKALKRKRQRLKARLAEALSGDHERLCAAPAALFPSLGTAGTGAAQRGCGRAAVEAAREPRTHATEPFTLNAAGCVVP